MRNIIQEINKKFQIILWLFVLAYIIYFSYFSILRYKTLYASYYDLGIMNQTVYNTYIGIKEKNPQLLLEMTDPDLGKQMKRMEIHNDLLLVPIAFLYFIHAGPETLLIVQSIVLAMGALAVFGIAEHVLEKIQMSKSTSTKLSTSKFQITPLFFSLAYLLYPPMQRANIFDFHPVTFATTGLLFMFYFWLKKKYWWSFVFFVLSIISKEQVGLTTAMFGTYIIISNFQFPNSKQFSNIKYQISKKNIIYSLLIIFLSIIWVWVSFSVIIPYFRGSIHFAVSRYGDFGDSPTGIIGGIVKNPLSAFKYLFNKDAINYFFLLLGPLGFLSLLSPIQLLISLPEFAINLLSREWGMKSIIYHYTAVITPFVFVSAIYGMNILMNIKFPAFVKALMDKQKSKLFVIFLLTCILLFSYFKGPLPFTREQEIHPFKYPQTAAKEVEFWANTLKDDKLKISTTGQVAPHFSSRRYLYYFSNNYSLADYVVVRPDEVYNYPEKDVTIPVYERLIKDTTFERIYKSNNLEIYKKI